MNASIPWFVLLCPLLSAAAILLFLRRSASLSALISVFAACFAFLGSAVIFLLPDAASANQIPWIDLGPGFRIPLGVVIDPLSKVMLLVVTAVGALVHIYSLVYMAEDSSKARYFGGLSLFMFSMLGIVLADNFVMMFLFWELVGVSSYLLIGHWFTRDEAARAAKKAFIANRIGDFGFMTGILMVWSATGSVVFDTVREEMPVFVTSPGFLTVAALCIFCGAVGKSAQFPLHVWLPDAMEGPTPVSALIHAATMVAAGVYMLARVFFLLEPSATALNVIAWVGSFTALLAALIATQQDDIKRVLAYSTLSQLGYMVAAVGFSAPGAAMFHLYTHAFFKALLFLAAGSVIHALHHEQNIWRMGGLRQRMPITFITFLIGSLALMGCPPFSGFFSKDAVLLAALNKNWFLFACGLLTAFLTAFYMTRLLAIVFFGSHRSHEAEHGHESPAAMTLPLILLAVLSVVAGWGFIATPLFGHYEPFHRLHEGSAAIVPTLATMVFLAGLAAGWLLYSRRAKDPVLIPALRNRLYVDELYSALIAGTQDLAAAILNWFDKWIVDGLFVRGLSGAAWGAGFVLRFCQFGNLQGYAFIFGLGVVGMIYFVVFYR